MHFKNLPLFTFRPKLFWHDVDLKDTVSLRNIFNPKCGGCYWHGDWCVQRRLIREDIVEHTQLIGLFCSNKLEVKGDNPKRNNGITPQNIVKKKLTKQEFNPQLASRFAFLHVGKTTKKNFHKILFPTIMFSFLSDFFSMIVSDIFFNNFSTYISHKFNQLLR